MSALSFFQSHLALSKQYVISSCPIHTESSHFQGQDIGGTLKNNVALSKFAAAAGFFMIPLRILVNPLNSWFMLLPMGQLYRTTSAAMEKRVRTADAYGDMLSHWLSAREKSGKPSLLEIEAQANVNVGAGAEPVSSI
jgi:hypothetical protein